MATTHDPAVPNHHADHPGFSGVGGFLAALTMIPGRSAVSDLAMELAAVGPSDHVVDIGCGPGSTARRAAARTGARVTAVDPADVMLGLARRLDRSGAVTWARGAAESLPLADGEAGAAWSIASVHHWPEIDAALTEVLRVLAPGGRFVAIERRTRPGATGLASHGWTAEQADAFRERCQLAGFERLRVESRRVGRGAQLAVVAVRP